MGENCFNFTRGTDGASRYGLIMTTIAYKDGIIAYDSRSTDSHGIIWDDDENKRITVGEVEFFLCGTVADFPKFIDGYLNDNPLSHSIEVCGFIYQNGKLYCSSVKQVDGDTNWYIWREEIRLGNAVAYGSGEQFAMAYMDMGFTAAEAVQGAMKRDTATGGKIRTFILPVANGKE